MTQARLLWLTENAPPDRGGMSQSCDRIVRSLRGRSMEVDLVHLSRKATQWTRSVQQMGRLYTVPVDEEPGHALNLLWSTLEQNGARESITHVVAFGGTLPLLGAPVLAAWLDRPLVTLLRGNDFDTAIFSVKRRDVLNEAMHRSSAVAVVTRDHERKVSALFPDIPLQWIPNGIQAADWQVTPGDRERALRWRTGNVAPDRRVIGMFGHLKQKKGAAFFIEALLSTGLAGQFHILVVGDVERGLTELLEERRGELPSTIVPFVDHYELIPYYCASDIVAIPSFYDGMPNTLLEAGATGRPLMTSTAGGMGDVLVDGQTAIVFESGNRDSCRSAFHRLAGMEGAELTSLGEFLKRQITRDLTIDIEAARYERLFSDAATRFAQKEWPRAALNLVDRRAR